MNTKLMKKWIDALRSRKYKQGVGSLRAEFNDKNVYCCLGVLCDIYDQTRWKISHGIYEYQDEECVAPIAILDKVGISPNDQESLIQMNDQLGRKFYQIARWLERRLNNELNRKSKRVRSSGLLKSKA